MTVPSVDLLKVTPPRPVGVCTVNNRYIVSVDGMSAATGGSTPSHSGTYSIYDTVTGTEALYDGLGTHCFGVYEHGGYAWCASRTSNIAVHRINPVTGGLLTWVNTLSFNMGTALNFAIDGTWAWLGTTTTVGSRAARFDLSTFTFATTGTGINGLTTRVWAPFPDLGLVYSVGQGSSNWTAISITTGTVEPSENWASGLTTVNNDAYNTQVAILDGRWLGTLWLNDTFRVYDFVGKQAFTIPTEPGSITPYSSVSASPTDNMFYVAARHTTSPTGAVTAIDPVTLTSRTEYVTARTHRSTAVEAQGMLWSPAGDW